MRDVDTIIHLAGSITVKEYQVLQRTHLSKRMIIHTTGIYSRFGVYLKEYKKIENYLFDECKIDYIILRPTMIYSSKSRIYNMHKLIGYIKNHKVFPVFGSGNNLMQPIHARDLATAIVLVLNKPPINLILLSIRWKYIELQDISFF